MTTALPVFVGHTWDEHINAWKSVTKEIEDRQWALGAIADSLTRNYGESSIERFAGEVRCKPSTVQKCKHIYAVEQTLYPAAGSRNTGTRKKDYLQTRVA